MISRIILAALDRLFIILLTGTTKLGMSEFVQDRLHPYRVNTLTHPRNRFNQQPSLLVVYGVHAQKIINHFVQNNGPDIFQHDNTRPHTTRK